MRVLTYLPLLTLLISGCNRPLSSEKAEHYSIVDGDTLNHKFIKADSLLAVDQLEESRTEYTKLRLSNDISSTEIRYATDNEHLIELLIDDQKNCDSLFDQPDPATAIHKINLFLCNPSKNIQYLKAAEKNLSLGRHFNSIHYLITLEQLGNYYYKQQSHVDSAIIYYKKSLALANAYPSFQIHRGKILFSLAELSVMFRDVVSGMGYVQAALQEESRPLLRGHMLVLKGTLHRRLRKYDSAEQFYAAAITLFNKLNSSDGLSEVLREKALMGILTNNQTDFTETMNQL